MVEGKTEDQFFQEMQKHTKLVDVLYLGFWSFWASVAVYVITSINNHR